MLKRRLFLLNSIKIFIIFSFIFILPTRNIFDYAIVWIMNSYNKYFIYLIKLILVIFFQILWTKYDSNEDFHFKRFRNLVSVNPLLFLVLLIFVIEIIFTILLFRLDKSNIFPISSDSWLTYIITLFETTLTILGLSIAIKEYVDKKDDENRPNLKFKISTSEDFEYLCDFVNNDNISSQKIYLELINLANRYISYPRLKYQNKEIDFIGTNETKEDFLTTIESDNNNSNNKSRALIKLILPTIEGMNSKRVYPLTLTCEDENNYIYAIDIYIEFNRYDSSKSKIKSNRAKKIGKYRW